MLGRPTKSANLGGFIPGIGATWGYEEDLLSQLSIQEYFGLTYVSILDPRSKGPWKAGLELL